MKKTLTQKLALLSIVSFLSYTAAVVFSPLAYPSYDWMSQAVSDLSASSSPSLLLWNSLSAFYSVLSVVSVTVVCIAIEGRKTKLLRCGIYTFAIMEYVSAIGYRMFPLSESGFKGSLQDMMHMIITFIVVILSIASLVMIIIASNKSRDFSYCVPAIIALSMMLIGAMGTKIVPLKYFGIFERFSVFGAVFFNLALGLNIYFKEGKIEEQNLSNKE